MRNLYYWMEIVIFLKEWNKILEKDWWKKILRYDEKKYLEKNPVKLWILDFQNLALVNTKIK